MSKTYIPEGYKPRLSLYDTQKAIEFIKQSFQRNLCAALNLKRVSAPLFVRADTGLNDNLSGVERPVSFDVPSIGGAEFQIVHSLAKWKRWALKKYDFHTGNGLVTDMNAIRRDEEILDNLHSVYVDQWDWERIITRGQRNVDYLKQTVSRIVNAVCNTGDELMWEFPVLSCNLKREVFFVGAQELEDMYPELDPKQREHAITKEHKTVFIMNIGKRLRSGKPHDSRAPDYDDWDLNGDILFWNDLLEIPFEISSMGIRVDETSLMNQLKLAGKESMSELPYHKALLAGELPLTIGGGIGQSRLCMLLIGTAHIGEVQSGVWDDETYEICGKAGVPLL